MKHPALARLFSIALAILCLIMLLAGAFGLSGAREDNRDTLADYDRLQGRIEEYRTVTQALVGTISYEEANKTLQELQEQHDSDASQHRSDLAMYTATKGGLATGEEALKEAETALDKAWKQFEAGEKEFQEKEAQFNEGYEAYLEGLAQIEAGKAQVEQLSAALRGLSMLPATVKDIEVQEIPGQPEMPQIPDDPEEETPETEPESMAQSGEGSSPFPGFPELPGAASMADRDQAMQAFDSLINAYDALGAFVASLAGQELPPEMLEQMQGLTDGIALARKTAQDAKDSLGQGSGPVVGMELMIAQATHSGCKQGLAQMVTMITGAMGSVLEETRATLTAGEAAIKENEEALLQGKALIDQGKKQLEQARAALVSGDAKIETSWIVFKRTLNDLQDQGEELKENKETLEKESQELAVMTEETRRQRDLEKRQTSLRVMLLDRDGIETRYNEGMELMDSANAYSEELLRQAQREYQTRFAACILMIIGGLAGILHIPSAFEKLKSRLVLITPVLVCLGCAVGAEVIFETMGRGSSYSAIFAAIFAAVQLLVILPKAKKPGASI